MPPRAERINVVRNLRDAALRIVSANHTIEQLPGLPGPAFIVSVGNL